MLIKDLEQKMLRKFPEASAEDWDTTGLTSGDESEEITKVAVCLDPSLSAIKSANAKGCNLLVSHHPAYIGDIEDQPETNIIFDAPNYDVALMNFHTALDVSKAGASALPDMLGLKQTKTLLPTYKTLGFGKICRLKSGKATSLGVLANKCEKVFERKPRLWGKANQKVSKIVTTTGSVGRLDDEVSVLQAALDKRVDCIICGEVKYHDAIYMIENGVGIIDLGHDISELPLVDVLYSALIDCGIDKKDIIKIEQNNY